METHIHNEKATCSSILNYAEEKEGALDTKGKAELKGYAARLDVILSTWQGTKEALSDAKEVLALSVDALRRAIIQSRKALEMVAVGERKLPNLPNGVKGKWFASRIHDVAVSHMQALENAGNDSIIVKARALLKTAIDTFAKARNEHRNQQFAWKNLKIDTASELEVIGGKLAGYRMFASYSVPRPERRVLRNRIKAVVPTKGRRKKATETVAVASDSTTTQPPAFPAIPTVPVPQTGEHPTVSANA